MQTINVAVRTDRETGRPILFFWNHSERHGYFLQCYDRIGQHSDCDLEYMRRCRPIKTLGAAELALLREWSNMGPASERITARPVARLSRHFKGVTP